MQDSGSGAIFRVRFHRLEFIWDSIIFFMYFFFVLPMIYGSVNLEDYLTQIKTGINFHHHSIVIRFYPLLQGPRT